MNEKKNFNSAYKESEVKHVISNRLGSATMLLIDNIVDGLFYSERKCDVHDIVKSDILLECLTTMNKLFKKKEKTLNNPHGYFLRLIKNVSGRILRERFSSVPTRDEFGYSLADGKGGTDVRYVKFVDVNGVKDTI
jgi:hypothetical protein